MRRWVAAVSLLGAALVAGCHNAGNGPLTIVTHLAERPQAIEVHGIGRSRLSTLRALAPNDPTWSRVLAVYVERDASDTIRAGGATSTPAILGRYSALGDGVRFEPRFPFTDGVRYRVEVDSAALAGGEPRESSALLVHRFAIPAVVRARTTRVTGVFPSSPRVPSNLLRWYVETSAPMEPGGALEHIHLVDESGRAVVGAFLALDQELWDPARRRLTLLFDPGRVKRGIRTNVESGAPLVAGRRYRLVIDPSWSDAAGAPLASGFELAFEVGEADRRSPDPARWNLTMPSATTRDRLQVAFGESLDHALAARLITVVDATGAPVMGAVSLAANDSAWLFTPELPWTHGDYTLRVGGALEDLAGNNIVRVFDVDRRVDRAGVDRDVAGASRSVPFRIGAH